MTEYDYSPAAYDKYMRTQNRVSNWVSHTKAHERQYSNPFVASIMGTPAAFSSQSLPQQKPEPKRSKSNGSTSTGAAYAAKPRPSRDAGAAPQRSKTLDSKQTRSSNPGTERPSRSRSFSATKEDVYAKPRSRSHHAHTRTPQPQPYPQGQAAYHHYSPQHPMPQRSHTSPHQPFAGGGSQPIYMPSAQPGQTYVIIPPGADRRVEYQYVSSGLKGGGTAAYPNSPPRTAPGTPRGKEPFFKRLWGGLTRSGTSSSRPVVESRGRRSTF
ncbi:hypothetical protein FIBSPDRAFT_319081 [Athelia psychrophila]|uniref:Uncharacterized protein n=1 Tax=Athelia psychrophila TaxID=1759441 RepID=A0A166QEQ2_9AGAM|nr:hypothetical protein FIBSPDRAFT_319081 [Fibularhizoctonia sp. CBS 109695]